MTSFMIPTCSVLHLSCISPLIFYDPRRAKCKTMAWVVSRRNFNCSGWLGKKGRKGRWFRFWQKAAQTEAATIWKRALTRAILCHPPSSERIGLPDAQLSCVTTQCLEESFQSLRDDTHSFLCHRLVCLCGESQLVLGWMFSGCSEGSAARGYTFYFEQSL